VLGRVRRPFRALVVGFVPESADLSADEWRRGEELAERLLSGRPGRVRRQVTLLIVALNLIAAARFGRTLPALDPSTRSRLLTSLQDSPLLLVRRGVWGLRTLAFLVYYGREQGRAAVGYRASASGWASRRSPGAGAGEGREP